MLIFCGWFFDTIKIMTRSNRVERLVNPVDLPLPPTPLRKSFAQRQLNQVIF
jgi:hypothetical protein